MKLSTDIGRYLHEAPFILRVDVKRWNTKAEAIEEELEKVNSQLRRSNLKIVTLSILLDGKGD